MGFIDSYKRLEKLCGEIYADKHGITAYIDEMTKTPGARYIQGWHNDLKQLKNYRWVRNQIVHDPGCTEENMCADEDVEWLEDFYERIMSECDPLTQYRKARNPAPAPAPKPQQTTTPEPRVYTYPQHRTTQRSAGCLTYIIGALLIVVAVVAAVIISLA